MSMVLTSANFSRSTFNGVKFECCEILNSNYEKTSIPTEPAIISQPVVFEKCNIIKTTFLSAKLPGIKLVGCKLTECHFNESNFKACLIKNSAFNAVVGFRCNWEMIKCEGDVTFTRCNFIDMKASGADFRSLAANKCFFLNGVFSANGINRAADFVGCQLNDCKLGGADFDGVSFENALLKGCQFNKCKYKQPFNGEIIAVPAASMRNANLTNANLRSSNLDGVCLENANLSKASLMGATLKSANLRGTNFQGADLTGVDLTGADLTGADLTGARLDNVICRKWVVLNANFKNVDVSTLNIKPKKLAGAMNIDFKYRYTDYEEIPDLTPLSSPISLVRPVSKISSAISKSLPTTESEQCMLHEKGDFQNYQKLARTHHNSLPNEPSIASYNCSVLEDAVDESYSDFDDSSGSFQVDSTTGSILEIQSTDGCLASSNGKVEALVLEANEAYGTSLITTTNAANTNTHFDYHKLARSYHHSLPNEPSVASSNYSVLENAVDDSSGSFQVDSTTGSILEIQSTDGCLASSNGKVEALVLEANEAYGTSLITTTNAANTNTHYEGGTDEDDDCSYLLLPSSRQVSNSTTAFLFKKNEPKTHKRALPNSVKSDTEQKQHMRLPTPGGGNERTCGKWNLYTNTTSF